jgi:uncharacterized protein YbgA (DUF1722 family)/uncharacterized protein YbbK (DUF523 family)
MEKRIRIGISECLLGHAVRYDGGHKWDRFLTDTLGKYVEYVPVCPEVECGLGMPREAMRLAGNPESPRLTTIRTHRDFTDRMVAWARKRVRNLEKEDLCGFIFKSDSPSSGMERVKIYDEKGFPAKVGRGIFARIFMEHFPLVPVEDEGRLHDPKLRENFIESLFTLMRWRELLRQKTSLDHLVRFHSQTKLFLLSHSEKHHRLMGKMVASGKQMAPKDLYSKYESLLMETLKLKTSIRKNVNVLQHMMGYFKNQLSSDEKQELLEVISDYRKGYIPLIGPITLTNHYVRKYKEPYLAQQSYLHPHPVELQLRNHA